MQKQTRLFIFSLALLLFVTGSIWYVSQDIKREPVLMVAFLDVGQGDAIFIESPSGKQMLVDAGPSRNITRALSSVMPFYDHSIDVVVATHPDADHIGGFPEVFSRYDIGTVIDSGVTSTTNISKSYEEAKSAELSQYVRARRGQVINFQDGAYARVLFPDREMTETKDTNSASVILQIVYGSTTVMLTGDAPKAVEKYVMTLDLPAQAGGQTLHSDILKAGHHGSKTSTDQIFLQKVLPIYAIISAGKENKYGHPHEEVLSALHSASTTILSTANLGSIIFESNGKSFFQTSK